MVRKPAVGGDRNRWGAQLNTFLDDLDARTPDPSQVAEIEAFQEAFSYNIFDPAHPAYGAVRSATVPSTAVMTANTAAINAAAASAAADRGTLVLKGIYYVNGTLHVASHVDARSAEIRVVDTTLDPVMRVGTVDTSSDLRYKFIILPNVVQLGKSVLGLGTWGSDVGVEIANLNSNHVFTQRIAGFAQNLRITAYDKGNAYNEYHLGHIDNGKIGLHLDPQAGGWVNENNFYGGRFSIDTGEGTNISGARYIKTSKNFEYGTNNNRFHKPSIENNPPEYQVEFVGASYTILDQARWEAAPRKLRIQDCDAIVIWHGYQAESLQITEAGTNSNIHVWTRGPSRIQASGTSQGLLTLQNRSSDSAAAISVLNTAATLTTDSSTAYQMAISAQSTRFKNSTDTQPRIEIDHVNGRIGGGFGSTAPSLNYIRPFGSSGWQANKKLLTVEGIGVGNSVAATTPGTVTRKIEVFDQAGTSIGFIPVYDAIT